MDRIVYFVRHGETDWNAEGRLQGQVDTDLNAKGRSQADRNGRKLAELISDPSKFDFVASPLRRTRDTMEHIRTQMNLPPKDYRTDPVLVEVHFGDWQGHTFEELEATEPGCFVRREVDKWNFLPPGAGAESYDDLAERIRPWFEGLQRETVCVTHGGIVRSVFRLTETMTQGECAALIIPQDRVLRLQDGRLDWL
ncbi:histidine phosphatase family protein [Mesorhizobium sp. CAU 1732]|uniref:histidine phosphatase family protein n=1 Tax=Mesorhizobium sp. CAU 1732 TaxID=3140358 RepID=UPI00326043EB